MPALEAVEGRPPIILYRRPVTRIQEELSNGYALPRIGIDRGLQLEAGDVPGVTKHAGRAETEGDLCNVCHWKVWWDVEHDCVQSITAPTSTLVGIILG